MIYTIMIVKNDGLLKQVQVEAKCLKEAAELLFSDKEPIILPTKYDDEPQPAELVTGQHVDLDMYQIAPDEPGIGLIYEPAFGVVR